MVRGALPKAYLRISPDLDQHEDPMVMVLLICAANRQPQRGRFKSSAVVERIIGRKRFAKCVARGDLVHEGTAWYLDGWDEWQEGDLTVGERMRRLREKRGVASNRNLTVSQGVSQPYPERIPPSEASRRLGVKASRRRSSNEEQVPVAPNHIGTALSQIVGGLRS